MKRAWLAALVPLSLLLGSLVSRGLLALAGTRFAIDRAQPLTVVTAWGSLGGALFAVFVLALAAAALAAFAFARVAGGAPVSSMRTIWCAAAAALVVALGWPVVFSSDVYAYAAYGELSLRGFDPYVVLDPSVHAPLVDAARWQWQGSFPPCVYGPLFAALASAVVALTGGQGIAVTLLAFRALAALAWLADVYLFSQIALAWFPGRRIAALALFALNPLALWCAAEGHNDTLMLLPVLLGVLAVQRGALVWGGLALGATPLLKVAGAAAGPVLALYLAAGIGARRVLPLWAGYLAGLAMAAAITLPRVWPALTSLRAHGSYDPQVSLPGTIGLAPALALAAVLGITGLRWLARGKGTGAVLLAAALVFALPNPYPWYMLWVLPVAAAAPRRAGLWLWAGTIAGSLRYLPDVLGPMRNDSTMLAATFLLAPFALAALLVLRPAASPRRATVSR